MEHVLIALKFNVPRDNFYYTFLFVSEHVEETPKELSQRILNAVIEHDGGDYLDHEKYRKIRSYKDELWHKHGLHRIDTGEMNEEIELQGYTIKKLVHLDTMRI